MTRLSTSYNLLIVTGLTLFIISFFLINQTVDLHLLDTYFVVDFKLLFWTVAAILIITWLLYAITKQLLFSKYLTWIHIIITTLTSILISTIPLWNNVLSNPIKSGFSFQDIDDYQSENNKVAIIILIMLVGQVTYLINVIVGFTRRAFNRR
jgi:hypothetical protein